MADIQSALDDDEVEPQSTPQPAHGSFREIYSPLTRKSYVHRDGEWILKTQQMAVSTASVTGEEVSSRSDNR